MSKGIRAFIAIDLPESIKEVVQEIQFDLMDLIPEEDVNWVKERNMHMTLFFLGNEVPATVIPQICSGLDHIAAEEKPFTLSLAQIDAFPSRREGRVLWVGLESDVQAAKRVKHSIDLLLKPLGWHPDKRGFTPHITLGYVKNNRSIDRLKIPYGSVVTPKAWQVDSLNLYHSQLSKSGPKYKIIHTGRFGEASHT